MENNTYPFYFYFTMFEDQGFSRYIFFMLSLVLYVAILASNVVIILVVFLESSLHEPMYFFISCLSINSLYGSAGFFPRFMMDLLSDTHLISRPGCFIQIYIIYTYTYASYEFTILTIMAYDRYVAISKPLHYHSIMNLKAVSLLIAIAWIYPVFTIGFVLFLSSRLPLCGNKLARVFCTNWPVVQLSCVETKLNNAVGLFMTTTTIFLPLGFVLYTYLRIILVCKKSSAEFRGKALQTCLPHIVTFVNYSITLFCELTLSRYDADELNPLVVVILSIEFLVVPPILNPLVYGLNLPQIRRLFLRFLPSHKMDS